MVLVAIVVRFQGRTNESFTRFFLSLGTAFVNSNLVEFLLTFYKFSMILFIQRFSQLIINEPIDIGNFIFGYLLLLEFELKNLFL